MRTGRKLLGTTLVVGSLVLAGCGDSVEDRGGQRASGDAQRYCELSEQLDAAGEEFFAPLGENPTPEQVRAVTERFVAANAGTLDELVRVAPSAIARDVRTFTDAFRAADRDNPAAQQAEERVMAWEEENCA